MEFIVIIWLISAGIAAYLVREDKQALGALVGFLGGPLGIIIAVALWGKNK